MAIRRPVCHISGQAIQLCTGHSFHGDKLIVVSRLHQGDGNKQVMIGLRFGSQMQPESVEIHSIRWGRSPSRLFEYIQEAEVCTCRPSGLTASALSMTFVRPCIRSHTGTRRPTQGRKTDLSLQKHSLPALPKSSVAQRMQGLSTVRHEQVIAERWESVSPTHRECRV